jgi:hypothetical protein
MGNQATALPSELVAIVAELPAISSNNAQTSVWADAAKFRRFCATVSAGVFGSSATIDFKLQQATSSSGAGAKDIPGAAITQLLAAGGNNRIARINLNTDALDAANGFRYVAMIATVGTAASLVAARMEGFLPFNAPASLNEIAGVVQTVSV